MGDDTALILTAAEPDLRAWWDVLRDLNGRFTTSEVEQRAKARGTALSLVSGLIQALDSHRLLIDEAAPVGGEFGLAVRSRWAVEHDVCLLRDRSAKGWRQRRDARVDIVGAGPIAAGVANMLAVAGVTDIRLHPRGTPPKPWRAVDLTLGGPGEDAIGKPAHEAIGRSLAAWTRGDLPAPSPQEPIEQPTLALITHESEFDAPFVPPHESNALLANGVPHLILSAGGLRGEAGPLVIPGSTACLHCREEHRRDKDPGWPPIAAAATDRIIHRPQGQPLADAVTVAQVVALGAAAALGFIERRSVALAGSVAVVRADGQLPERRPLTVHPRCGCRWTQSTEGAA